MDTRHTIATVGLALCIAVPAMAQCPVERQAHEDITWAFGISAVEIEGDHLVIGDDAAFTFCPFRDTFRCSAGGAFAYRWDGSQWNFIQLIVPPDIGFADGFASDLKIEGDRMLVTSSDYRAGQGVLFEYRFNHDIGHWVEFGRVYTDDFFGFLAVDGSLALAYVNDRTSRVLRFTEGDEGWEFRDSFEAPDAIGGRTFGQQLNIKGDWAFISASLDSSASPPTRHGSVYVYRRHADDTLEFTQKLLPPAGIGEGQTLNYGASMDFDGTTLAVSTTGATVEHAQQGVVYLYELDGDQWTLRQTLTHSDAGRQFFPGGFGRGVTVNGDTLVAATNGSLDYNFAYVFKRGRDGVWREVAVLGTGDATPAGALEWRFGARIAIEGDRVVISAPHERTPWPVSEPIGAAYAFDLSCEICRADLDHDGALTIFDYLAFFNAFAAGDLSADFDGDGELTLFDFLAFQTAFDAGCL